MFRVLQNSQWEQAYGDLELRGFTLMVGGCQFSYRLRAVLGELPLHDVPDTILCREVISKIKVLDT